MSNEDLDRAITYHGDLLGENQGDLVDEDLDDLTHIDEEDGHSVSRQSLGSTSVDVSCFCFCVLCVMCNVTRVRWFLVGVFCFFFCGVCLL